MPFWHSACGPSSPDSGISADKAAEDADISRLLGMLTSIPDPRSPQGKQYPLEFTLAVCVVAMLAGAKNYTEIARHAADMPQSLLRKLGAKWNWFRFRYQWPGRSAIWNVLTRIVLGERASLEQGRRTATVRALTDCRVVSYLAADLPAKDLRELATGHHREDQQE